MIQFKTSRCHDGKLNIECPECKITFEGTARFFPYRTLAKHIIETHQNNIELSTWATNQLTRNKTLKHTYKEQDLDHKDWIK